jgi:CBS-domain-containing membrane protein
VIDSPFSQPRALFGGHFLGALTGICITKLFHLLPTEEKFENLVWLAGSLSCATAVVVMQMTGTTHPPAGQSMFKFKNIDIFVHKLIIMVDRCYRSFGCC